ncbi:MAG: DUF5522 domain-containing protein [Cytophagales bacterium]|nr:DUF5522 domain-containing protein [Cytophagales bacterium]
MPFAKRKLPNNRGLDPEDYYFDERGLMVFTQAYHLKRGYCCGNRCRHCPYGVKDAKTSA